MKVTEKMRMERALKYLKEEKRREEEAMEKIEGISIRQIIIVRNKKRMYMAELDQMIRNIEDDIARTAEEVAS